MISQRRVFAIIILFLAAVLSLSSNQPTRADTVTLVRSDPPADAVLVAPPPAVILYFSAPIDPKLSHLILRASSGQALGNLRPEVSADGLSMRAVLGAIPDGIYTVIWQAVSNGDRSAGSYSFSIVSRTDNLPPPTSVLLHFLEYVATALLIGGASFWLFMAHGTDYAPAIWARLRALTWAGWFPLGILILIDFVTQASQAQNVSHLQMIWLLRTITWIGLGAMLGIAADKPERRLAWWNVLIVAAVLVLITSLDSHSANAPLPIPAFAADWLHEITTMIWIGGLVHFFVALSVNRSQSIITAFFNLSRAAIAVLLVTGLYLSALHLTDLSDFTKTLYGQTLLLKLVLTAPLFVLMGINIDLNRRNSPRLRSFIGGEIALTAVILLTVSILSLSIPPRDSQIAAVKAQTQSLIANGDYADMQMTPEMHIILDITPGFAGQKNTFAIDLYDLASGNPIDDAQSVKLQFIEGTSQSEQVNQLTLTHLATGEYTASGDNLREAGAWRIRAIITGSTDQHTTSVNFDLHPTSLNDLTAVPDEKPVLLVIGVLGAVLAGGLLATSRRQSGAQMLSFLLLVVGILCIGSALLMR